MKKKLSRHSYDVIIIGSGIAGLTAAAVLSKAGLSCCVLERQPSIGGYLSGFSRQKFRFDTALHWLNQFGEGGMVSKTFDFIGSDYPKPQLMERIFRFKGDQHDYTLTNNPDALKAELIADFPHEKKGIERYFARAKRIGESFEKHRAIHRAVETMTLMEKIRLTIKKISFARPLLRYILHHGDKGVQKGLNLFFKDKELHKLYPSEPDFLSCILPVAWAYNADYYNPPVGGSQVFPEWLSYVTKYFGNDIIRMANVKKIILEGKQAKGVIFEHRGQEHRIESKYVIAACDVETLYEKMLPPEVSPQKMKDNLRSAELYSSSVTISIALDCPAEQLGFGDELTILTKNGLGRDEYTSGDPEKTIINVLAPSTRDRTLAPKGKGTLTLYTPASIEYGNSWAAEVSEQGKYKRTEAYRKFKDEYAQKIIDRVAQKFAPSLKEHILFYEVATPITHWRYTHNRGGSIMGARPGKKNMQAKIAHYETTIKNLILGGHWADLGGGVPIAVKAATNASLIVLQREKPKAFEWLAKYIDERVSLEEIQDLSVFKKYDNSWVQKLTPAQKINKK